MKPTLRTLSALALITLSYNALAKDLYLVSSYDDKPYNELQILDLDTKETSKLADINYGGRLAVIREFNLCDDKFSEYSSLVACHFGRSKIPDGEQNSYDW
ncbi:hypothetical protein N779_17940 [Vibrio coralliilyticus OCN008]|nr:hypothetical protein N779_17940 [Vibrio coralliilyticus OCN008]